MARAWRLGQPTVLSCICLGDSGLRPAAGPPPPFPSTSPGLAAATTGKARCRCWRSRWKRWRRSRWWCDFAAFLMLVAQSRARGAAVAMPAVRCQPSTATAQCACGFGAKARAGSKKFVRRGGREFFVTRNRCTARIPPQSPVTLHYHRTARAACVVCTAYSAARVVSRTFRQTNDTQVPVNFFKSGWRHIQSFIASTRFVVIFIRAKYSGGTRKSHDFFEYASLRHSSAP